MGFFEDFKDVIVAVAVLVVVVGGFFLFRKLFDMLNLKGFLERLKISNEKDAKETLEVIEARQGVKESTLSPGSVLVSEVVDGQNVTFKFDAEELENASFFERSLLKKGADIDRIAKISDNRAKAALVLRGFMNPLVPIKNVSTFALSKLRG